MSMFTVNTNPETGIRYGVTNHIPSWMWDHIQQWDIEGWEEIQRESSIKVLKEKEKEIEPEMLKAFYDEDLEPEALDDPLAYIWENGDVMEFVEEFFQNDWWHELSDIEDSEMPREGEIEGVKLRLSYLGGAPLLWVLESPRIVRGSLCSPCVPNAVSLDSLYPEGYEGYGLPKSFYEDE